MHARPGRFRWAEPEDLDTPEDDIDTDSDQVEDPSELRIFLAQEGVRTIHEFRVLPFHVWRVTRTAIFDEVTEFPNLRHDMVSYEARYPAAVEVRNSLGDEIWNGLEEYRCEVAYLAFSTLLQQTEDPIDFPLGLCAALDQYIPHMEQYIAARWTEEDAELFQMIHDTLETCIEEERARGIEIQQGGAMRLPMIWFRRQPIFGLVHNLHFPAAEGRMSWEQVSTWAIQWLRRTNMEAPAWPPQLRGLYVWNPDTTTIWNGAVLELFADIRRRFSLAHGALNFLH